MAKMATERTDYSSTVPFNVSLQIATGLAFMLTRATLDDNGFRTFRLMKAKRQALISPLMRNVLREFDKGKFTEQLTKLEFDISENESGYKHIIPELLKTTMLITKTSVAMYR